MNSCPVCSSAVTEGTLNCPACGASLGGTQPTVRQPQLKDNGGIPHSHQPGSISSHDKGHIVAGTTLDRRYRVVGLLGRGGMGEVYKAEDLKLNQTVALKFLPENFARDRAALERFYAEVRTARQVSHPNVCRVFDIGEVNGSHFLSMEFIDGDDLSSLLRRIGRLPPDKAVETARQLCAGLHAVHQAGVLHRDLKPANVIIDGRGRARITDFGIAGLADELKDGGGFAGTPAYMSPEQITGGELTAKSDIYSLGLVLYEIFTGKQAFAADTLDELRRKHRTETPTNPSEFVKDMDPLVERVIFRCLEKDPRERPDSALQVALMLPGGNPLEAALEAGETPSPEMVAAAPKKGALKPAVALACLASVVALFAFIVFFSDRAKLYEQIPLEKSPEVLAERSRQIINKLGYGDAPRDAVYGYEPDLSYLNHAAQEGTAPDRFEKIRTGQPVAIYFWHRTSPRYLVPNSGSEVSPSNPPVDASGMTRVALDVRGRLIGFEAVPPQVEEKAAQGAGADWPALFAEAGLDIRDYRETESRWTPPFYADERKAWEGGHVDHAEIPVRIEAAAFRRKPVYFNVVFPWDKPARQTESSAMLASDKVIIVITSAVFISILLAALIVARHNLKVGRGDTRGASKLGLFVFAVITLARLVDASHVPELGGELWIFSQSVSLGLLVAALTWVFYVALEPFIRRRWSELMISWSRLMAGDFRDPLVGRDVLVGGLLGLAYMSVEYLKTLLHQWLGIVRPPHFGVGRFDTEALSGIDGIVVRFLHLLSEGVFATVAISFLLLLLLAVLRKKRLAIAALWLIIVAPDLVYAIYGTWLPLAGDVLLATIATIAIARFGMLTFYSYVLFIGVSSNPITSDFSNWYANATLFALAAIMGLALYGFHTSLAGQPLLKGKLLED